MEGLKRETELLMTSFRDVVFVQLTKEGASRGTLSHILFTIQFVNTNVQLKASL